MSIVLKYLMYKSLKKECLTYLCARYRSEKRRNIRYKEHRNSNWRSRNVKIFNLVETRWTLPFDQPMITKKGDKCRSSKCHRCMTRWKWLPGRVNFTIWITHIGSQISWNVFNIRKENFGRLTKKSFEPFGLEKYSNQSARFYWKAIALAKLI